MSHVRFLARCKALAIFALLVLPCASRYAQAAPGDLSEAQKQEVLQGITDVIERFAFVPNVDFKEWETFLAKQEPDIKKATTDQQFAAAIQKAFTSFGLSHIYLMTPTAAEAREKHSVVGIGIAYQPDKEGLLVTHVFNGSAAFKAGVLPGDIITLADGKKIDQPNALRGEPGTKVHVTVKHPDGKLSEFDMIREPYDTNEPDTLKWVDKHTAVLRVPTFDLSYDSAKVEDLMREAATADNLVVDMRGNPGGQLIKMLHLLDLLMPPGTHIGTIITANTVRDYQKDNPGKVDIVKVAASVPSDEKLQTSAGKVPFYRGKIAVLINGGSGSAAEMLAAALHDKLDCPVLGTKSAGAVLISIIGRLPDGYRMQYPISDYVTISGHRLEGAGVTPDVVVKDPRIEGRDKDEPLEKAVAVLEKDSNS